MNFDLLLLRHRFKAPDTAVGWIFFLIAFVLLVISGNDEILKKFSGDPIIRRIIRIVLIILLIFFFSASIIADLKLSMR